MAASAEPQLFYYNFLTDVVLENVTALRTSVEPPAGTVRFTDSDLAAYIPTPWPSPWALLDLSGATPSILEEVNFLRGIGYGVDVADNKMLVMTGVVTELYGPQDGALFRFPGQPGDTAPNVDTEKMVRMAAFLETRVVPLYARRARKQMAGIPDTVRAGADLRRDLREVERLVRDLKARIPMSPVGNTQ